VAVSRLGYGFPEMISMLLYVTFMNTSKAENALFIVRVLKNNNYSMEGIQFPLKQKRIRVS